MSNEKIFYDVHCHAMNLSHPNILAFIQRVLLNNKVNINEIKNLLFLLVPVLMFIAAYILVLWTPLPKDLRVCLLIAITTLVFLFTAFIIIAIIVFVVFAVITIGTKFKRLKNLLSVMENDSLNYFLIMEEEFKKSGILTTNKGMRLKGVEEGYSKIILTPLIMDFGVKNIKANDIYYNKPPHKPVVEQVLDIFNGINHYAKKKGGLILQNRRYVYNEVQASVQPGAQTADQIFEIYPFLGINTANYDTAAKITSLLDKYFSVYKGDHAVFRKKMGTFPLDIDAYDENLDQGKFSNFFAGIKVYPPLGFDPWPAKPEELAKVEALYAYCMKHKIPITAHCNPGGFKVVSDRQAVEYSSPKRWQQVLENYKELKLNLAHFGDFDPDWLGMIIAMMKQYDNVYSDFSYHGVKPEFYAKLAALLREPRVTQRVKERILFGSDFMINLQDCDSYDEYLRYFMDADEPSLTANDKHLFCCVNPAKFLWEIDG